MITEVVPGQRQHRVEDWLRRFAERLASVEESVIKARLREPENLALFEEGASQAMRAVSEERRQQIAEIVAGGISDPERDHIEGERLLRLLGELDDAEVVLLASHLAKNRKGDYQERHANVLRRPALNLRSSRPEVDAAAVRAAGRGHLLRLGLLEEWTPSGATSTSLRLSSLGRLLLRRIGLAGENEV